MNRQDVEKTITEYLKPIFGFALKRCKSIHDAEDLSQEITIRAFRALLIKDDVADMGKFIWTVAHNTLSNYYRDTAKSMIGVSIDEVAELIADPDSELEIDDNTETIRHLQTEIAYLSKLQRRIVRNKSENRLLHKESKRNLEWSEAEMRKTSEKYRLNSYDGENLPFENYIKIDNTTLAPDEVAKMIQTHFAIEGRKE